VHPRGESKKFNIARGELKEKNYMGKKQNSPTLQGYQPIYPNIKCLLNIFTDYDATSGQVINKRIS
jgi:hypothetical protein